MNFRCLKNTDEYIMFAGCTAYKWTNKQSSMINGKKESLDCL